jgi:hypothetical protein
VDGNPVIQETSSKDGKIGGSSPSAPTRSRPGRATTESTGRR